MRYLLLLPLLVGCSQPSEEPVQGNDRFQLYDFDSASHWKREAWKKDFIRQENAGSEIRQQAKVKDLIDGKPGYFGVKLPAEIHSITLQGMGYFHECCYTGIGLGVHHESDGIYWFSWERIKETKLEFPKLFIEKESRWLTIKDVPVVDGKVYSVPLQTWKEHSK